MWASVNVGDGDIQAAAFVGGERPGLVVLEPGYLAKLAPGRQPHVVAHRRVNPELGDPAQGPWWLLFDGTQLWAVSSGTDSDAARIRRIDPVTLNPSPDGPVSSSPGGLPVTGAAVLDGHLYLKAPGGIFVVVAHGNSAPSVDFAGLAGGSDIVADPRRHRLLTVEQNSSEGYTVAAIAPRGTVLQSDETRPPPAQSTTHSLYLAVADLAVVGAGPIWAAIRPVHGPTITPTLMRLNPTTLGLWPPSQAVSPTVRTFRLIAGASRLWLRDTGVGHRLWCLDADTGAVLQHWSGLAGTIVPSPHGGVYLAHGHSLGLLKLNHACTPAA